MNVRAVPGGWMDGWSGSVDGWRDRESHSQSELLAFSLNGLCVCACVVGWFVAGRCVCVSQTSQDAMIIGSQSIKQIDARVFALSLSLSKKIYLSTRTCRCRRLRSRSSARKRHIRKQGSHAAPSLRTRPRCPSRRTGFAANASTISRTTSSRTHHHEAPRVRKSLFEVRKKR